MSYESAINPNPATTEFSELQRMRISLELVQTQMRKKQFKRRNWGLMICTMIMFIGMLLTLQLFNPAISLSVVKSLDSAPLLRDMCKLTGVLLWIYGGLIYFNTVNASFIAIDKEIENLREALAKLQAQ
jgi:hypothetical protein